MSEKPSPDEIEAVVRACALPMSKCTETFECSAGHDYLSQDDQRPTIVRHVFQATLDHPVKSRPHVVDVEKLINALTALKFERPTEDETIRSMERVAFRLRVVLQSRIDAQWEDRGDRQKLEILDAYIAGLRLQLPESLRTELEETEDRIDKEDDPEWSTYKALHKKFGGEHP